MPTALCVSYWLATELVQGEQLDPLHHEHLVPAASAALKQIHDAGVSHGECIIIIIIITRH